MDRLFNLARSLRETFLRPQRSQLLALHQLRLETLAPQPHQPQLFLSIQVLKERDQGASELWKFCAVVASSSCALHFGAFQDLGQDLHKVT